MNVEFIHIFLPQFMTDGIFNVLLLVEGHLWVSLKIIDAYVWDDCCQHTRCYLLHILCYNWFFCTRTLHEIDLCWAPNARIPVTRSDRTWVKEMEDHRILGGGCPTWFFMMHPQHSPKRFLFLIYQEACYHNYLVSSTWMILHII